MSLLDPASLVCAVAPEAPEPTTSRSQWIIGALKSAQPSSGANGRGLAAADAARLLHLVRSHADPQARQWVIDAARRERRAAFGNDVAAMVPIEVTSYCASTCKFCGWRADNKDRVCLAISVQAIRDQARVLAEMGSSHFEIAGGDHLPFLKKDLKGLVKALKEEARAAERRT